jgi:hypothetical protein
MALIECPECKHTISDRAVSCPSCGVPLSSTSTSRPIGLPAVEPPLIPPVERQGDFPSSQIKSFGFAKIYAILCFFGCLIAAYLAVLAAIQILQTGDWLNNPVTQRSSGRLVAMLILIVLWSITGSSILRRRRRAITLSEVGAVVALLGIVFRGIVPLEIVLAIPTFAIIPYLRRRSAMLS